MRRITTVLVFVSLAAIMLPGARADVVSEADTKRFLDPTVMISKVEYRFQANHLPDDLELYTNRIRPWLLLVWDRTSDYLSQPTTMVRRLMITRS